MISVLMSTHNGSKTIDSAIQSILNQTYSNFRFVICDDGSTDNTWNHLLYWSKRDKRIILIKNSVNKGLQISLNKCIRHSDGSKYIARMDDDDLSLPNRFQKQVEFLNYYKKFAFVSSYVYFFDNKGKIYGENKSIKYPNKKDLLKNNEFYNAPIMIRSNILKKVNGYSISRKYYRVEDYELWLRLYSLGYRGANIPIPLFKIRKNLRNNRYRFYDYFDRFKLILEYTKKWRAGIWGYYCVSLDLLRLLIPPVIRNVIYLIKYSNKI